MQKDRRVDLREGNTSIKEIIYSSIVLLLTHCCYLGISFAGLIVRALCCCLGNTPLKRTHLNQYVYIYELVGGLLRVDRLA